MTAMIDVVKESLIHQYEAALATLGACVEQCPYAAWNGPVGNLAFCQVALHTLFFADYYLGESDNAFREQPFHRERPDFFRDYEELQPRQQVLLYDKSGVLAYLTHCRRKAAETIAAETAESLAGPSGFERRRCSRLELHVYNVRHIQHHAAQLSLRLRLDVGREIPWVSSGWTVLPFKPSS
jgi:hypothetical protein